MDSVDLVDISSTDGDRDIQDIDNHEEVSPQNATGSIKFRGLPSWASKVHSNLTVQTGVSRKRPPSSKRDTVHNEISSCADKQLNTAFVGTSTSRADTVFNEISSQADKKLSTAFVGTSTSKASGNISEKLGSNNSDRHCTRHEVHSSYQSIKRALPASFHPSTSSMQSRNLAKNLGANEIRRTYGKPNQPSMTWSKTSNGNCSAKENVISGSTNNSLFEKKGHRLLPPSLISGKHSSATSFIGPSNSFHDPGLVEERYAGADEKSIFQAAVRDLHQPNMEATLPEGLMSVSLLRHQEIALAWMLDKESSGLCLGGILADDQGLGKTVSTIALIQMQKTLEAKSILGDLSNTRTKTLNSNDDDGSDDANQIMQSDTPKGFDKMRPAAGTLIVCPASVLRQWAWELDEKVSDDAKLSVLVYHGSSRTKDPVALAKYDIVVTTYAIVTNEGPKQPLTEYDDEQKGVQRHGFSSAFSIEKKAKKVANKKLKKGKKEIDLSASDSNCGTLARVKWSRIVLDESQTIKNHKTRLARACFGLRAERRWCLSGTPIQNSVDELFSYFRFLKYDPYDKYKTFVSSIKALISQNSVKGYKKLQVVLRNIMLRRTKDTLIDGKPIITLPPRMIHLTRVKFSSEEQNFYDKLEAESCKQFKAYAAAGTVRQNYVNILYMLLRLRQACDHPVLVKGFCSDPIGKVSCEAAKALPRELLLNLLGQVETSSAICLACLDPPENVVVTRCGHVFCYQCVSDYLTGEDNTCPAPECREQLGADVVYSKSTLSRCISDDIDSDTPVSSELGEESIVLHSDYVSSKIKAAIKILKAHFISTSPRPELCDSVRYDLDVISSGGLNLDSERRGKAIVFSQWTSMLDFMELSLKNSHIGYRRLDGTMSIPARDQAVKDFHNDPEVDVMLMSLKAGNLGLNMVVACLVILLDLWWNPTTEDQAIDRAHRIGQSRAVTVSRLTIKDTVEDRILALQEEKRKMVASAFGEDGSGGHSSRLAMEDLRFLFEGSQPSRHC